MPNHDGFEELLSDEVYDICGFVEIKTGIVDSATCAVLADAEGEIIRVKYDKIKIIEQA